MDEIKNIDFLKLSLIKGAQGKKVVSLKGVLKGIKIEEYISEAKIR